MKTRLFPRKGFIDKKNKWAKMIDKDGNLEIPIDQIAKISYSNHESYSDHESAALHQLAFGQTWADGSLAKKAATYRPSLETKQSEYEALLRSRIEADVQKGPLTVESAYLVIEQLRLLLEADHAEKWQLGVVAGVMDCLIGWCPVSRRIVGYHEDKLMPGWAESLVEFVKEGKPIVEAEL